MLSAYGGSAVTNPKAIAYSSRVGEIRTLTLADASRLTLDTASRIEVFYSAVAGRARFEVAHAFGRPFVVVSGTRAVLAHCTVLDVRREPPELLVVHRPSFPAQQPVQSAIAEPAPLPGQLADADA